MFTVTKEFSFEAAHSLPHLTEGHKCRNLHGHSYKVVVCFASEELDHRGFVVDYAEITSITSPIVARLDHQNLNEVLGVLTTAENLAAWIYNEIDIAWNKQPQDAAWLDFVEVRETEKTSVIFRP